MRVILSISLVFFFAPVQAQDLADYRKEIFVRQEKRLPYRMLYPTSFDRKTSYPLIIFLHGAFEKGDDNESQLDIGGRYFLADSNRRNFPAIVIFPQCPATDLWAYFDTDVDSLGRVRAIFPFRKEPTAVSLLLKQLLDSLLTLPFVDARKVYIGGLSQGGMGVFDLVARYPTIFAAAFPICGAGKVSTADRFAGETAMWIFHGADDDIVPVYFSRQFYHKLKRLGADVRYTEYPGVRHNSWVNALQERDLLRWLFSKSKNNQSSKK